MNLFKRFKRIKAKRYDLRAELAKWVETNLGPEWVDEALTKYDKINSGIPDTFFDDIIPADAVVVDTRGK